MTDTKRSVAAAATSTTQKPTTPKPSSQGPGELDTALSKAIGARIKITTTSPTTTLEGTLFTACPSTNLIAVSLPPTSTTTSTTTKPQGSDYHIIPVSRIHSFSLLSLADATSEPAPPPTGKVDIRALRTREEAAIRRAREREAQLGRGVSREAQEVFDAMARTLPTRWHETSIVVSDTVIIAAPYGVDDCSAPREEQTALARVRRVLENERRKIAERRAAGAAGAGAGTGGAGGGAGPGRGEGVRKGG